MGHVLWFFRFNELLVRNAINTPLTPIPTHGKINISPGLQEHLWQKMYFARTLMAKSVFCKNTFGKKCILQKYLWQKVYFARTLMTKSVFCKNTYGKKCIFTKSNHYHHRYLEKRENPYENEEITPIHCILPYFTWSLLLTLRIRRYSNACQGHNYYRRDMFFWTVHKNMLFDNIQLTGMYKIMILNRFCSIFTKFSPILNQTLLIESRSEKQECVFLKNARKI